MTTHAPNDWLKSKAVEKALKIDGCTLMHLRVAGKLRYQKQGNAYLYHPEDVLMIAEKK